MEKNGGKKYMTFTRIKVANRIIIFFVAFCMIFPLCNFFNADAQLITFDDEQTIPSNITGKNMKLGNHIVIDNTVDSNGDGNSLLAKFWADFCNVNFNECFKDFKLKNGSSFKISVDAKLNSDNFMDNAEFYIVILDKIGNVIYNYNDANANCKKIISKKSWTKIELDYNILDNEEPYSVAVVPPSYANNKNVINLNLDNFSVEQTKEGKNEENVDLGVYAAAYLFDNVNAVPQYISGKNLSVGTSILIDDKTSYSVPGGKSIYAKYWANYCRLHIKDLFKEAGVQTGENVTVSFWAKIHKDSKIDSGDMSLSIYDDEGVIVADGSKNSAAVKKGEWTKVSYTFKMLEGMKPSVIYIAPPSNTSDANSFIVNIDDIIITTDTIEQSSVASDNTGILPLMKKLGIATDLIDDINSTDFVTRAEFVKAMGQFYLADFKTNLPSVFSDIPSDADYIQQANFLASIGVINGTEDGKFSPDEFITTEQAIKIMCSYLGYDLKAKSLGGYPTGYLVTAQQIGLTDGVILNDNLTKADILLLFSNFINTDINEITSVGEKVKFEKEEGNTVLSSIFNVYKGEGIVTGTSKTLLGGKSYFTDGCVEIDGELFRNEYELTNEFLGYRVDYYYKKDTICNIIFAQKTAQANYTKVVFADQIESYSDGVLSYSKDDTDKISKISVPFNAKVIFNGKAYSKDLTKAFDMSAGSVVFIDADYDGNFETIIIDSVKYYVVDCIDSENNYIFPKFYGEPISLGKSDDFIVKRSNGRDADFSSIKEWDVVGIRASNDSDDNFTYVTVNNTSVNGRVTDISSERRGKIFIEGKPYNITTDLYEYLNSNASNETPSSKTSANILGKNITAYLSADNEVVGFKVSNTNTGYAYVIDGELGEGKNPKVTLKILTSDNKIQEFELKEKFKLNGENVKTNDINRLLEIYENGDIKQQVISYTLDDDKKVKEMLTPRLDDLLVENEICKFASNKRATFRGSYFSVCTYNLKPNTVVFRIPTFESREEKYFQAVPTTYFVTSWSYLFDGYTTTGYSNNMDIMVLKEDKHRGENKIQSKTPVLMINDVGKAVTDDGDDCLLIKGINSLGVEEKVKIVDEREDKTPAISKGDIIMYVKNEDGMLYIFNNGQGNANNETFRFILDADGGENGTPKFIVPIAVNTNTSFTKIQVPYAIKDGYLYCNETETPSNMNTSSSYILTDAKCFVYDKDKKEYRIGDFGNIRTYQQQQDNASKIMVFVRSHIPHLVVTFE